MGARPLAGYRVLDLSRLLPGPWCTQLLADLGADVLRIETPTAGDHARVAPAELGFDGLFASVNRGKRSVAVNYRVARGREVVLRLARNADVFVESAAPGQMARRGLGPVDLHLVSPSLIYCSLSSAGPTGHDPGGRATARLPRPLDGAEGTAEPSGIGLADLAGGTLAALQIVAALAARERTGHGAVLDVAARDAVVAWLAPLGAVAGSTAEEPAPRHRAAVPDLGQHTRPVLSAAGWSDGQIAELEAAGVVAGPPSPERIARARHLGAFLARLAERPSTATPAGGGSTPTDTAPAPRG